MAFWGLCCGGRLGTSAAELTREEVVDLFTLSTKVNEGRLIVHGLFARADTKNTNGRIYPKAILKREVRRFKGQHIRCGSALGELNHPSYYSTYFRSLNLPNISHQVLEVHWRGNELWGTIEVLPTPAGLLLWELYSRGIKLGVSSRGWASVVADPANNRVLVDDDFQLITFDFVTEPSNAGAYLVPIRTKYRKPLPDQLRAVRAAYLGFGSADMANVAQLPAASVLSKWLKSTKKAMAAAAAQYSTGGAYEHAFALSAAALQQPPAAIGCSSNGAPTSSYMCTSAGDSCSMLQALHPRSCMLPATTPLGGGVVLGCHYRVLQEPWLPVDPAGREFKVHLSLVATKAHIMQQKQKQRQQGKAPAAASSASSRQQQQQQEQQVPNAVVTLAPPAAAADLLNTTQSVACTQLQLQPQFKQQQPQASHSTSGKQQQQQQLEPASTDLQQQQQLQTKSTVREALCTTSTNFSLASNISLGPQHLAAAREVLLCSASTDMSGCSLGPVVPPSAGHSGGSSQHARQLQQHQQLQQLQQLQQAQQRTSKAQRRPQSAPGFGISSLQPCSWDWDRHTQPAHAAAARRSALQTVQVNWEQRLQSQAHTVTTVSVVPAAAAALSSNATTATVTAVSNISSTGSDAAAVGIPAAAGTSPPTAAATAAAGQAALDAAADMAGGAVLSSTSKVAGSRPGSANKQLRSLGIAAAAAAEDGVQDSTLRRSNDNNMKLARVAAWHDGQVQQQQQQQVAQLQQSQDAAAITVAVAAGTAQRQQQGCTLDEEYLEIRDTLQRYQSEYRRQRQHLRQEAGSSH